MQINELAEPRRSLQRWSTTQRRGEDSHTTNKAESTQLSSRRCTDFGSSERMSKQVAINPAEIREAGCNASAEEMLMAPPCWILSVPLSCVHIVAIIYPQMRN